MLDSFYTKPRKKIKIRKVPKSVKRSMSAMKKFASSKKGHRWAGFSE